MAIEIARSNEVTSGASGTASRGKSGASGASDAAGSFGAVLASMDEAPAADAAPAPKRKVSDTAQDPSKASDSSTPADTTQATASAAASAAATAAAASDAASQAATPAPTTLDPSALLLAQSTLGAVNVTPAPMPVRAAVAAASDAVAITGVTTSLAAGVTAGAANTTAGAGITDPSIAPEAPGLPTTPLAPRPAATTPGVAKDTGTVESPSAALAVNLLGRGDGRKDGVKDSLRASAMPDAGAVSATRQAAASANAAAAAADAAATARALAPAADAAQVLPAVTTAIANEIPAPWRRLERAPEGSAPHASLATGNDTALSASPFITAPDAAGAGAAMNGAGFTERLVEQVSWWMAQRSQGAELKLEMPGGAPVSVSVQVTGNEAHVAFRSDSPEARQWLGAALPQLKEMFGNEGLMLSGASVGQSGTGAEQEAARDAQRALRSGAPTGASGGVDAIASPAARPRTATERALDLYV